ncbi:response regulator transcription factor [Streptomyces sp. NPDC002490]|uniref:response regulator transcription factor n=1 Tax=Streptomyces sp. NPDC002490 TaxID=3154416 RepID=UPI0033310CBB
MTPSEPPSGAGKPPGRAPRSPGRGPVQPPRPGRPAAGRAGPVRILLADDHALVRRGVRLILDGEPDLLVVAEAGDGAEAVVAARSTPVDLAILDIGMPRMTGLQAARELTRRLPHLRILFLTMYDNEQYFFEALKVGASGYVLKSVADRDLVEACRAAMRDEPFVHPGAVPALVRGYLERVERGERLPARTITEREEEILKLVAEGHTSKEIADLLVISVKTVERHRANLLQKLGLKDRLELTRYAIRAGLIDP